MSRERVPQVWLPAAGVYAALPGPSKPESSAGAPVPGSPRRKARSTDGTKLEPADQKPLRASPPAKRQRSKPDDDQRQRDGQVEEQRGRKGGMSAACTGFRLQCSDAESSDVEELEPAPTCPICLVDVVELADKAVVTPCMHEFCEPCISRWLGHHKRLCPLCKARVGSVLYDITPSGNHRERVVPPSPKLAVVGSGDGGSGGDGAVLLQRLQDFLGVAGLLEPSSQRQQQQQQGQRRRRGQQQGQQPTAGHVRLRTESGSGRSGRPGTASTSTTAAAAAPSSAGPRPYFWRLQQRLQAGGYRPGAPLGGVPAAADEGGADREDYVLLWRRQVYDQDLWAEPLGSEASRLALGTGSSRERRLTEWIERELRALLQTDDVTILRGFVMGLVAAYGAEPLPSGGGSSAAGGAGGGTSYSSEAAARRAAALASSRAAGMVVAAATQHDRRGPDSGGGGGSGGGALSSSPEEALRPFLYEHSAHFWHELRCFATAPPYTLATYDRMVRYRRREPMPPPPPQAAAAAPSAPPPRSEPPAVLRPNAPLWQGQQRRLGGTGLRASRWDQGRPGQPPAAVEASASLQAEAAGQVRRVEPARLVARGGGAAGLRQQAEAADASVPRLPRQLHRSRSRNPSPPPMPLSAAELDGQPQRQQQLQQQASHGSGRRSRSSRRRRSRSRGSSRARGERGRSRSRSLRGRRRHRSRGRSTSWGLGQERRRLQPREPQYSPGQYRAGSDDGGDRWGM